MQDNARQQFLTWVKRQHPAVYKRLARDPALMLKAGSRARGRRGNAEPRWIGARWNAYRGGYDVLGQAAPPAPKPEPSWFDKIISFAGPLLQAKQQKDLFSLQLKRAEQGLPPLAVEQYAPAVRVQAGIDSSVWVPLGIAAGGVAAIFVLPKLLKPRGRRRG